jgi:hypothetical protein
MSELAVVVTKRWILYTINDLIIIPYSDGECRVYDKVDIKHPDTLFYPIGMCWINHIGNDCQVRYQCSINRYSIHSKTLYFTVRDWVYGIYRFDDIRSNTREGIALRETWQLMRDYIVGQLY